MRLACTLLVSFAVIGCVRAQPDLAIAADISESKCALTRLPEDTEGDWRVVTGDGFTYCVPGGWQAIGPRAERWRSPAVDVSWNDPAPEAQRRMPVSTARVSSPAPMGSRYVTERVDGRTVRLEIMDGSTSSSWMTNASFLEPSLRFYATARTAEASREVIAVVRSVRFSR